MSVVTLASCFVDLAVIADIEEEFIRWIGGKLALRTETEGRVIAHPDSGHKKLTVCCLA